MSSRLTVHTWTIAALTGTGQAAATDEEEDGMRSEPLITVTCDRCMLESLEVGLTATGMGYDERNIDRELESNGWVATGSQDICPGCQEDEMAEEIEDDETI
jgi:hypothetical protein